jgi:hypothetical protein
MSSSKNPLPTSVVKFGRPTIGMTGNPMGHLHRSSILQEIRHFGSPKRMGRECIRQPGVFEPAFQEVGAVDAGQNVPALQKRQADPSWA